MSTATARPVTKAALSAFVREHTSLNLTQSKALTDSLLTEYSVIVKPPPDPEAPVELGQLWLHTASGRPLRVTGVEMGPLYVPGAPVTSWGPQSVSWQVADGGTAAGSTEIRTWRERSRLLSASDPTVLPAGGPQASPPTAKPESELPS